MKIFTKEMLCFLVGFVPCNPDEEIYMCGVLGWKPCWPSALAVN